MPLDINTSDNQESQYVDQERVLMALKATGLGTWDFYPAKDELIWDQRCQELFDIKEKNPTTYSLFLDCLHPDDREWVDQVNKDAIAGKNGGKYDCKYRVVRKDKTIKWIRSTGQSYIDSKTKTPRFVGTVEDITESVENKEKLQMAELAAEKKARVLETVNHIGSVILTELDRQKVVQIITDEATKISGAQFGAFFYTLTDEKNEIFTLYTISGVDKSHFDKFPMPRNTKIFGPTFNGEKIIRYADVTKEKNYGKNDPYYGMPKGHLPVRSYLAAPVISKKGDVLGGLFFGHSDVGVFDQEAEDIIAGIATQAAVALENADIYDQLKRSNNLIAVQKERMYNILDQSPSLITITLGKEHEYSFLNKKSLEIVGNVELLGRSLTDLIEIYPAFKHFKEINDRVYETGETVKLSEVLFDMRIIKPNDHRIFYFDIIYSPIYDDQGQIEGIVRYGLDITDQVISRNTIENFIGISSHELKTPLTTVISYIDLIKSDLELKDYERIKTYVSKLEKSSEKLNSLISDLLDVTKIRAGKFYINAAPVKINAFLEEVINNIQDIFQTHKLNFISKCNVVVQADQQRLEQTIINLISNAVKYSPKADKVDITCTEQEGYVLIAIRDYGVGIESNKMEHLFQQFYRISERHYAGLGIGLFICKEIINQHKGEIQVESKVNKGSTFTIKLPASN